ncbi:MAG TPA: GNAT family N-acetyltransferase [Trueperaceae bacterium]
MNRVPHPTILEGRLIRLEPMAPEHIAPLLAISSRWPEEYALTSTPVDEEQASAYFATAFAEREAGRAYPFTIFGRASGEVIGSTRFADIRWQHRNAELGYTWFRPDLHRSGTNVESKLLMLDLAFERLGWVRVQIHTDTRNVRSQRAIEALGAVFEGELRRHMIVKGGFIRDTRVYSVVDLDWPRVRERLRSRLIARGVEPTV